MAKQSEGQKVSQGVETGLPKRDYKITVPNVNIEDPEEMDEYLNLDYSLPDPDKIIDTRIDVEPPISDQARSEIALQAASIRDSIDNEEGKHLIQSWDQLLSSVNPKSDRQDSAYAKADKNQAETEDAFIQGQFQNKEQVLTAAESVAEVERQLQEERDNPHLAYVRSIQKEKGIDAAYLANKIKTAEMVNEIWDNMDKIDVGLSIGGLMAPFNVMKDNYDVSGNPFGGQEFLRNVVINFKRATPEDQARMLPILKNELFDKLDNEFKVMEVFNALITPGGEEHLESFDNLWAVMEAGGGAFLAGQLATRVIQMRKSLNAAKVANEVGNGERASQLTTAGIVDPKKASQLGLDQVELANIASPFKLGQLDAAYTEGLSGKVVKNINDFSKQMDNMRTDLEGSDLFIREGLVDVTDRMAAEKRFVDAWKETDAIDGVEVVNRTGNSTVFRAKKGDQFEEETLELSLGDNGVYENKSMNLLKEFVLSPNAVLNEGQLQELAGAAQRVDQAQAKIFNALMDYQREAVKTVLGPLGLKGLTPTGRKQLEELSHVLLIGDARKEVYKYEQLRSGIDGVPLKDNQIEAYFKIRKLNDSLWQLRNTEKRQEKLVTGIKQVHISDDISEFGKPLNDFAAAQASLSTAKSVKKIFDSRKMKGVDLNDIDLAKEYDNGRQLVRLESPTTLQTADELWTYALVNAEDVAELPMAVIPYRVGQVPKFNKNARAFVKEFRTVSVNGVPTNTEAGTVRVFDNMVDAEKFSKQLADEAAVRGDNVEFRALTDRQLEAEARVLGGGAETFQSSGMGTGARKQEDLLFGWEGTPIERTGAFESISRSLASLSRFIPRNEWRMGIQQKAVNTANKILPPNKRVNNFSELASLTGETPAHRFLKNLHNQIEDWMGFPTKSEQVWEATVQTSYEWALNKAWAKPLASSKLASKSVEFLHHADPVANARSAAFHSLLGWFNPIQLWVQAQGAAVAMSRNILNPVALARSIQDQTAIAASMYARNPESVRHVAKAFGMNGDDLIEMNKAWQKTGLQDSILMTADHAAAAQGRGIASDALSRAADKGLLFYRTGELFNRRVSFATSYREWQAANKGKKIDDVALKAILKRSNDFMLNLGRANRAAWQKGLLGLPTQFLQVGTKTMETLLGLNRNLTLWERQKLLLAQVGLYGSAGLGIANFGSNSVASMMGYNNQADIDKNMSPEVRKGLNEGMLGWMSMKMFGIDVEIGKRSSLLGSVTDFTDRILFEDTPALEVALGAFGATGTRLWEAFDKTTLPIRYGHASVLDIDILKTSRRLLSAISTWNNMEKALFMHNMNMSVNARGKRVDKRDFKAMEEIARGIGFRMSDEVQMYDMKNILRGKQQFEGKIADEIVNNMHRYALLADSGEIDSSEAKAIEENIATLYQIMPTKQEQLDLRNTVKGRIESGPRTEMSVVWDKWYKEFNDGRTNDIYDMHSRFSSYGIQQNMSRSK